MLEYLDLDRSAVVLQSHLLPSQICIVAMTEQPSRNKHLFSLVRLRADCAVMPTLVDFAPTFPNTPSGMAAPSAAPTFNQDRCCFTPAFILPQQKTQPSWLPEKLQFENRLRTALEEQNSSESVEEVAPSSKYCQICQEHFRSYHEHLGQKAHLLRWQHNEFNLDIRALCTKRQETSSPLPKRKIISKIRHRQHFSQLSPLTTVDRGEKKMAVTDEDSPKGEWDGLSCKP